MRYFLIYGNEDGGHLEAINPQEFLADVAKGYYGEGEYFPKFLSTIPDGADGFYSWPEKGYLIIKGEIVVPKPIQVATEFTIE